jgi:hypothetical protein
VATAARQDEDRIPSAGGTSSQLSLPLTQKQDRAQAAQAVPPQPPQGGLAGFVIEVSGEMGFSWQLFGGGGGGASSSSKGQQGGSAWGLLQLYQEALGCPP